MYNPKITPKLEKSKGQIIVSYAGDLILGVTDIPEVISCLQCGKTFNTKEALCSHKYTHKSEKFACKKCSYESSYKSGLKRHTETIHEGIKHQCPKCDFQARNKGYLSIHIQTKHNGLRYPCTKCEHVSTKQTALKIHIKSIHEGVKYPCDQCDYKATTKDSLNRHQKGGYCQNRYPKKEKLMIKCVQANLNTFRE